MSYFSTNFATICACALHKKEHFICKICLTKTDESVYKYAEISDLKAVFGT